MSQVDRRSSTGTPNQAVAARAGVVIVAIGTALCAAVVIGWRVANDGMEPEGQNWWLVVWFVAGVSYSSAGIMLASRPGRRLLGCAFLVVGATSILTALAVQYRGYEQSLSGPAGWSALASADAWARPFGAAVLVALVPQALLASEWNPQLRVKVVQVVAIVATAVLVLASAVESRDVETAAAWAVAAVGLVWMILLGLQWWRQRSDTGDPLPGWLLAGVAAAWVAAVPEGLDLGDWSFSGREVAWALLLLLTVPLLAVGTLIDELRRTPSGAEQLSHRALEWTLLTVGIVVVYTVVVAGLGRLVGGNGPTWLLVAATGAVALAIEPARQRIRRLVDHLVFGSRDDPLAVVQRIVDHVGTDAGENLLPALVRSLERELRFDSIAIDLAVAGDGWERAASVGAEPKQRHEVLLRHQDEVVGRLVVGWDESPSMRTRDTDVLAQLAGPLALAVSWVRLAADLRRSSIAIVSAREEERRRLRRDLHDGIGPTLTGVSLGLRTAVRQLERATINGGPHPSHALLQRLAEEVDGTVHEIKRIVRDLRPTALDEFGLIGAVSEFAHKLDDDLELHLSLRAAPTPLPAAVEVAAYRIVTEALTNVVRHAGAERCWLSICADTIVEIDVVDDGVGIDADQRPGVGLTAMIERANEIGGDVRFIPQAGGGTHLHVELPATLR